MNDDGSESTNARRTRQTVLSALAGLEAGVIGALAMLVFLFAHSMLRGQNWWSYANLLGSASYGATALWRGFGRATLAGTALQLALGGLLGVVYGVCFARTRGRMVSLLLGLSCGLIWFFLSFWLLFRVAAPLIPVYASQPATLLAHVIFGLVLSRVPQLYQAWPLEWRFVEPPKPVLEASGTPGASEIGGTGEIVPRHRLE
jgi:hypothetical protein